MFLCFLREWLSTWFDLSSSINNWFQPSQYVCVCIKSLQLCLTLCDPVDCSPLSMSFSRQEYWSGLPCPPPGDLPHPGMEPMSLMSFALAGGFFTTSATWEASLLVRKVKVKSLSHVPLFATPWTVAYQVLLPMGFSRQEYWVGCYFLFQEIFPTQGLNPGLPHCKQMLYCLGCQGSPFLVYSWGKSSHRKTITANLSMYYMFSFFFKKY